MGGANSITVSFALEKHLEAHQWVDLQGTVTINTAITRTACYKHLNKTRFPE